MQINVLSYSKHQNSVQNSRNRSLFWIRKVVPNLQTFKVGKDYIVVWATLGNFFIGIFFVSI